MISLRNGEGADGKQLAPLILSSAPILLPYLFNGRQKASDFLVQAAGLQEGQYSASRHHIAYHANSLVGCITLWDDSLPVSFHDYTMRSLHDFLSPEQLLHLFAKNGQVKQAFAPALPQQLCVGHLAVAEQYRGRGIARQLIEYAFCQARLRDKHEVVLDVESENVGAVTFYQQLGFKKGAINHFSDTAQTFYRMLYHLK